MLKVCILCPNGQPIHAEVASTRQERAIGLSHRHGLAQGRGMLFAFDTPGCYQMTTATMQFPLDILWMDLDKRVVWLVQEVPQPQFGAYRGGHMHTPHGPASSYVLELAAGEINRLGLKVWDVLRF